MKPSREGSARSQAAFEGRCITGICAGGYKSQDWSAKKSYGEIVSDTHESAVTMTIAPTGNITLTSKEEFPQPTGDYSDVVATKAAAKVAAAAEAVDKIKMRCAHTHARAFSHTQPLAASLTHPRHWRSPCDWKRFWEGTLDRGETGSCILLAELGGMRLAPSNRAACKKCGEKFELHELCIYIHKKDSGRIDEKKVHPFCNGEPPFYSQFYAKNDQFCQDRLGTNRFRKKGVLFLCR